MQVVIMAGGKGTRLNGLTKDEIPKPMVSLLGKPLLQRQIEILRENNIKNIILVIGHLGHVIEDYFGNGESYGVSISYYQETIPLGTAGALAFLHDRLEEHFFLVFGDLLLDLHMEKMFQFHQEKQATATILVHPNGHPYDSDLVVTSKDHAVVNFDVKTNIRDYWYDNCVNAGLYVLTKNLCVSIPQNKKTDLENDLLQSLIQKTNALFAYQSPEYIKDVGTEDRIKAGVDDLISGLVANRNLKKKQKAIFLDRDGTINKKNGLIFETDQFELEEGVVDALRKINKSGYLAILITNQPVVARGLCSEDKVRLIHKKMSTLLGKEGVFFDDIKFCPHHPDIGYPEENPAYKIPCNCRKPSSGMIDESIKQYNIDISLSWMVGDTTVDIETGKRSCLHTALVLTGDGGKDGKYQVQPDITGSNLNQVIDLILERA